jgi:hypothetical protein
MGEATRWGLRPPELPIVTVGNLEAADHFDDALDHAASLVAPAPVDRGAEAARCRSELLVLEAIPSCVDHSAE